MKFGENKAHFPTTTQYNIWQLLARFHQGGGTSFGALDFAPMTADNLFDRARYLDGDNDSTARISGEDNLHHQGGEHIPPNCYAFFIDKDQLFAMCRDLHPEGTFEGDYHMSELV